MTASRYALVLRRLRNLRIEVDLNSYMVANGPSKGIPFGSYIRGRVDKGVAIPANMAATEPQPILVEYIAELVEPYAVLLR